MSEVVIINKKSEAFSDALWAKWPTPAQWPGSLDLYEAAAYRRISYGTIWRACQIDRSGKAALSHQRFGTVYRISRAALDAFGVVAERRAD